MDKVKKPSKMINKSIIYIIIVLIILFIVAFGLYTYNTVGSYTAAASDSAKIDVHAYAGPEVGATVTVIDQSFHDMGDTTWDGVINVLDLSKISPCLGKTDAACLDCCDLNHDGRINVLDLSKAASNLNALAPFYTTPFSTYIKAGKLIMLSSYNGQTNSNQYQISAGTTNTISIQFPTPVKTCNDGIDNNANGKCDYNGCTVGGVVEGPDPSCFSGSCYSNGNPIYDSNRQETSTPPALPNFNTGQALESLITDCNGDCRTIGFSPNGKCQAVILGGAALGINCENIGFTFTAPATHSDCSMVFNGCARDYNQVWNNSDVGWCQDSGGYDMETDCIKPVCTAGKLADIKETVIYYNNIGGWCELDKSPNDVCIGKFGNNWHALAVDCESNGIELKNSSSGTHVEPLTNVWNSASGNGWCQCGSVNEDMGIICTDKPGFDPINDVKVVIADCGGSDCAISGKSPDDWCQEAGPGWKALFVDCENINLNNMPNNAPQLRDYSQKWTSSSQGWCWNTGQAMTVTCVPPTFSMYYYP